MLGMKKKTRKKPQVDRRSLILDAAIRLFAKQGVIGTTFREIAKEAGVHQPLIGYYFPTFESLFKAVVEIILEDLKRTALEPFERVKGDIKQAFAEYIRAPILWRTRRPEYSLLWTFFYHLSSYQPMFLQINQGIRKMGRERITLLLYRYQENHKLRLKPSWKIDDLAYMIQIQITGAAIHSVTETKKAEELAALCESAVYALMDSAFEN